MYKIIKIHLPIIVIGKMIDKEIRKFIDKID